MRRGVALAAVAAVLAGCGSASSANSSSFTPVATSPPTAPGPTIIATDDASACQAWALLWPTVDQATISGNIVPLYTMIGQGGPQQASFALVTFGQGRLGAGTADHLSDDIAAFYTDVQNAQTGQSVGPLRMAAEAVQSDCGA